MAEEKHAPEAKQEQTAPAAPEAKAKKNKKISKMTLEEAEKKINEVRQKMGRLDSRYAKELLKRKEEMQLKNKDSE